MAGLDPAAAWDRTPGELVEYINAWHDRREQLAYMLYNHAALVANMCLARRKMTPQEAFPGVIRMQVMSAEDILASCQAWASLGEEAFGGGSGTTE